METLRSIALATIGKPAGRFDLKRKDGETMDIVRQILISDRKFSSQVKKFAPRLKGRDVVDTCRNIWNFVKQNVNYVQDPEGIQWVKSPQATIHSGFADCKSMSLFVGSCLKALGIPYSYRFVSYSQQPIWTHVYVVVPHPGGTIILDDVMPAFNKEKSFKFKRDYDMSKVYEVHGIGAKNTAPAKTKSQTALELGDPKDLSEGKLTLLIARQNRAIKKAQAEKIRGIGSLPAEQYQDQIDVIDDALDALDSQDPSGEVAKIVNQVEAKRYSNATSMAGIGATQRKEKRKEKKQQRKQERRNMPKPSGGPKKPLGKFLDKVAKGTGKALKTVAKVATAPARAAVKVLLEATLPKAAPFFLYLFVNDPKAIAALPAKAREKRKKAEQLAIFIVDVIGMKRSHFMGIVRNGILKKYGKEPEQLIAQTLKGKVSGIGFIVAAEAVPAVIELIQKIISLFKKKPAVDITAADAPDPDADFMGLAPEQKNALADEVSSQAPDDLGDGGDGDGSSGGRKSGGLCG